MGSVIKLSNKINNSYQELKNSVEDKLVMVDERIEQKLQSNVDLVKKMSSYHLDTGGKKIRALIMVIYSLQYFIYFFLFLSSVFFLIQVQI